MFCFAKTSADSTEGDSYGFWTERREAYACTNFFTIKAYPIIELFDYSRSVMPGNTVTIDSVPGTVDFGDLLWRMCKPSFIDPSQNSECWDYNTMHVQKDCTHYDTEQPTSQDFSA